MTTRDLDVENLPRHELKEEIMTLRNAIRTHMHMRGDDRCSGDDHVLYEFLPEGDTRPDQDSAVTIENCALFIKCRQSGERYVSPQRYIEELEAKIKGLEERIDALTNAEDDLPTDRDPNLCPYPSHHPSCECRGMGGDR